MLEFGMNDQNEVSGPIVESYAYNLNSWMADLHPYIQHLRVSELILASAHNAGMDNEADYSNSYITCQDKSFRYQLDNGIRVLDIRLIWFHGYGSDNVNAGLLFTHDEMTSGRTFANMLNDVDRFQEANPGEIVILDFHRFESNNNNYPVPYAAIHAHFMRHYTRKMLPRSAEGLTLEEIKNQYPGPRLIVAVPEEVSAGRDQTFFWDKLDHSWAGSGAVNPDRLYGYIQDVMNNPPFNDYPWSMSATVFGAGGPGAIIPRLVGWFPTGGDWQRKSSIINFDFVARENSAFIRHCISSNPGRVVTGTRLRMHFPPPGYTSYTSAVQVNGYAMPGATVTLALSGIGTNLGTAVADSNGSWKMDAQLSDGTFKLTCQQSRSGKVSRWTEPVTIQVITSIDLPTISTPVHGSEVNSVRPSFSGSGVPLATVRFYESDRGDILYGTARVDTNGNWSATPNVDLPYGSFALVCIQDFNGLTSDYSEVTTFTVNLPIPIILEPANGSVVTTTKPVIRGRNGVPGATVRFYESGFGTILYGTAQVDANGNWSATPSVDLPYRNFTLVCDQDFNGLSSGYSDVTTFTVNLPIPIILEPTNGSVVITTKPMIRGRNGVPGATVRFYESGLGNILYGTALVDADDNWFAAPNVDLPYRSFTLVCDQDFNGLSSGYSSGTTFTVSNGNIRPEAPKGLSAELFVSSANISWLSSGPGVARYRYDLNGQIGQDTVETSVRLAGLSSGTPYTLRVFAIGHSGLSSEPASLVFRTLDDSKAPTNFRVTVNAGRTMTFVWEPPYVSENLIGYRFKVFVVGTTVNLVEPTHSIYNTIPFLPMTVGVQCRFAGGEVSDWNQLTVTPQP
jgi:1-phosphatidylinositol phosphodiesterase